MIQEEPFMGEDYTKGENRAQDRSISNASPRTFSFLFRACVDRGAFWHGHGPNVIVALFVILSSRRGIHVSIFCDISSGAISSAFTQDGRVLLGVGHGLYDRGFTQAHTDWVT